MPSRFTPGLRHRASVAAALLLAAPALAQNTAAATTASSSPSVPLVASVTSSNAFALDLYHRFATNTGDNIFFSPYSISTALAMTWAGARGPTAAQFAALFHAVTGAPSPTAFGSLQQAITQSAAGHVQLAIANSLWPQQGHSFLPAYISLVQNTFASGVFPVDYQTQPQAAINRINTWVENQTNHRIRNLLHAGDAGPGTLLVLVNAIYFNGNWTTQFDPKFTTPALFHLADGSNTTTAFMHKSLQAQFAELPGLSAKILSIPYQGGNLSFIAILPDSPAGLPALEQNLTAHNLATWLGQLPRYSTEVILALPKFKLTQSYRLGNTLQALGLTDAFNPAVADFSGMDGDRDLFISAVIHQAFIDVNEQGTEAAAATAVVMVGSAIISHQFIPVFKADHPFLFLIRENSTGAILFLGRLASPPASP